MHETAFAKLGGAPRVLILDNLREGVLKPDIYDPTINPLYRDMLAHYQAIAMPCRIKDPDRKGKVESSVNHAQMTPLKGQRFETLTAAQAYLDRWEEHWADTRIHGTTKRQVAAMFAEEKPALLPLPVEPFRYYQYGERVVHLDGCVEVEAVADSLRGIGLEPRLLRKNPVTHDVWRLILDMAQNHGPNAVIGTALVSIVTLWLKQRKGRRIEIERAGLKVKASSAGELKKALTALHEYDELTLTLNNGNSPKPFSRRAPVTKRPRKTK